MKHCMIDLETLDTAPTAVILSIGACAFDPQRGDIGSVCHLKLEIDSQIRLGRTISGRTVDWWMNQSVEARDALFSEEAQKARRPVKQALVEFSSWLGKPDGVWGNGADFDLVLLGNLYDSFGLVRPWSFSKNRCFRTLKNLFGNEPPAREGVHHDALDDAMYQAKWAIEIIGRVKP